MSAPARHALTALLVAYVGVVAASPAAARRPNVIVIVTDDQRWDELFAMPTVLESLV